MMSRHATREGLSMIELLIVVTIIIIISTMSIPVLSRMGLFSSSRVDLAARDIFATLRAARIYAASNNVQAGIAYAVKRVEDSTTSLLVPVIDAFVPVRQLSIRELNANDGFLRGLIFDLNASGNFADAVTVDDVYVPIKTRQGVFRPLPNGTSVILDDDDIPDDSGDFKDATALTDIVILDLIESGGSSFFEPRETRGLPNPFEADDAAPTAVLFPAHIFSTSGSIFPTATRQRITFSVSPFPDRPEEERMPLIDHDNDPDTPDVATPIKTDITLYTATGRVKVSG